MEPVWPRVPPGNGDGPGVGADHPVHGLGDVEIGVEDDGPGIDPLERNKVFERFFRGPVSGRRGTGTGSGLGLALVAEHVRLMHGRVRVEGAPSAGARFVIALPVATTDDVSDGTDDVDGSNASGVPGAPVGSDLRRMAPNGEARAILGAVLVAGLAGAGCATPPRADRAPSHPAVSRSTSSARSPPPRRRPSPRSPRWYR